jgi:glycosyltransferase involved in cell wall biosynthesis
MASDLPKVSGILPVGYGEEYFRVAADAFLASTYEGELELVILDNNETPLDPSLLPDDPRVQYHHCDRMPVGALRNLGTSYSTGDIIVNLDEDDYSSPDRITIQVARLTSTGKAVTGFHSILYFDCGNSGTYRYHYEPNRPHPPYACGSSQCYTKAWWEQHNYPTSGIEDYSFQLEALNNNELDSIDGAQLLVARAHDSSVCHPGQLGIHRQFPSVPKEDLPAAFYAAIAPEVVAKPKSKSRSKAGA